MKKTKENLSTPPDIADAENLISEVRRHLESGQNDQNRNHLELNIDLISEVLMEVT